MKQIRNFYFPDHDDQCHKGVFKQLPDVEESLKFVKNKGVCIQAGGNVGVWAKYLAEQFGVVYTFEPDPENFNCLCANVREHNVVKFNAGLADTHKMITVSEPGGNNCGAYQAHEGGFIPTLKVDDLNLPSCDLMYLDIEGYELFALQGAEQTIEKYYPVIALEQKPLPIMYGLEPDSATEYLVARHGYTVKQRVNRDTILVKE